MSWHIANKQWAFIGVYKSIPSFLWSAGGFSLLQHFGYLETSTSIDLDCQEPSFESLKIQMYPEVEFFYYFFIFFNEEPRMKILAIL